MAEELRKPPVLWDHDSTLGTVFRQADQNKNSIRHDRRTSVYLKSTEVRIPTNTIDSFRRLFPPKDPHFYSRF